MAKRGRKKGSTKEVVNLNFWKGMLRDNKVHPFINKGSNEQKETIRNVLKYLRGLEPEFFEMVNGQTILKQLKG